MMAIYSWWLAALPLVLRLVPRNLPRRPRDHALAGDGSPELATRKRPYLWASSTPTVGVASLQPLVTILYFILRLRA